MYLNILKRDLKRKKTMNIILLLFIILSCTFISSSVNNFVSITGSLDGFFERAELKDVVFYTINPKLSETAIEDYLNSVKETKGWFFDDNAVVAENDLTVNGKNLTFSNIICMTPISTKQQKFFNSANEELTEIGENEIYLPSKCASDNNIEIGDIITYNSRDLKIDFTYAGVDKDAFLGSTMMGASRLIISDVNYEKIAAVIDDGAVFRLYSVETDDIAAFKNEIAGKDMGVLQVCDWELVKVSYVMDLIIAGMMIVVSVILILISFVALRFTIGFTLSEEYREIGIMKAIGLKSKKNRGLYIVKYFAISVVAAVCGFFLSIPFGSIFMSQIEKQIILGDSSLAILLNLLCCIFVVLIVVGFCYLCTGRVNKFTPVDAIRNGTGSERFKKKGIMRLQRGRLRPSLFMALNDITGEPKRFAALTIIFTLCTLLMIIPSNTASTLQSESIFEWFEMAPSDLSIHDDRLALDMMKNGNDYCKQFLEDTENKLDEIGIPAKVSTQLMYTYTFRCGDKYAKATAKQGVGMSADELAYTHGSAPMLENEIALTKVTAQALGAEIGSTVYSTVDGTERAYIVTGFFQSMNSLGEGARFSESENMTTASAIGVFDIVIKYTDSPDKNEWNARRIKIENLFSEYEIYDNEESIDRMIGSISDSLDGISKVITTVVIFIDLLVALLMVKSFITKEKTQIGTLKAIGFRNSSIISWQIIRIGIILAISTVIGMLLSEPLGQITAGKVFEMMGAEHIVFHSDALKVYVIYPLLTLAATLTSSIIAAQQVRHINASETSNIE